MSNSRSILILLLLISFCRLATPAQSPNTVGQIARQQSGGVVVLEALDVRSNLVSQGSGFIVTPAGAIVTSLHVLRGATSVRVRLTNGDIYLTTELVEIDELKDVAIIRIKGFSLPVVTLGNSDLVGVGDEVIVISSPEGLTNSISTGIISGMRQLDTHRVFQISAPISQGSSGGAIFNARGEVIGIATYVLRSGQNINFAVPINYARGMVSDRSSGSLATVLARLETRRPETPPTVEREPSGQAGELDGQLSTAARGRRGRTALDPLFPRPDEALALFYRFVDG
ncbi:MAG: S1C family serine protease, partial [Acidobacteriota bacterium]